MGKSAKRKKQTSTKRAAPKKAKRAKSALRPKGRAPKPFVIDFHAHIVVPEVLDFAYRSSMFAQAVAGPGGLPDEQRAHMTDPALRLKEMDAMGVDMQVISPSILQQCT